MKVTASKKKRYICFIHSTYPLSCFLVFTWVPPTPQLVSYKLVCLQSNKCFAEKLVEEKAVLIFFLLFIFYLRLASFFFLINKLTFYLRLAFDKLVEGEAQDNK
jgi:hypothetical protein